MEGKAEVLHKHLFLTARREKKERISFGVPTADEKCAKLTEKLHKERISSKYLQSGGAQCANGRVCQSSGLHQRYESDRTGFWAS